MSDDETTTTGSMRASAALGEAVHRLEASGALDAVADKLQPAARRVRDGRFGAPLRGEWLGHALHPLLTDIPLGCWIGAEVLDLIGGRKSRPAAARLIGLGLLAVPITAASGAVDWSELGEQRERRVGVAHAAGNSAVATLYFVSWLARRRGRHGIGIVSALAGGGLAIVTGYLGGHLSFARGAGVGPRGMLEERPTRDAHERALLENDDELGVGPEQLEAMVADDLLVARAVVDDAPRFARSDLVAIRMVGG